MPLAYTFVAVAVMLAEVNYCAKKLDLPVGHPISIRDLKIKEVAPPNIMPFGGRLDTEKYSFCFLETGRLRFRTKLKSFAGLNMEERNRDLAEAKSIIGTNEAYQIATNWLDLAAVDLEKLGKRNTCEVRQQFFWNGDKNERQLLPVFDVRWGGWHNSKIEVSIDGRNKSLLSVRLEDDSYSKRPESLIKDMDKLLAIPDEEFLKMSPLEKSNLVVQFAAIHYPAMDSPSHDQTNAVSHQTEHEGKAVSPGY